MRKTAFIYCRISQDRTGAGLGIDRQEDDCRKLAEKLGMEVVRLFADNDISAFSGKRRPAYSEMLGLIEQGQVDAVLCWHTDRLHRAPRELEDYIDASEKGGVTTHAVQSGELDLSTPSGQAIARTLGAWARYESAHKSARLKRAKQQAKDQGKFTGGPVPFGWDIVDKRPVPNAEQAEAIQLACDMILAGKPIASILREFHSRGIKTARGSDKWNHASLTTAIVRPKIAGLREVDGELVADNSFPSLVAEDKWRGVRAMLSTPGRRVSFDNRNKWLLSGIAECECGSTVKIGATVDHKGGRRAVYRCKVNGPGHINRQAIQVERVVDTIMAGFMEVPLFREAVAGATSAPDESLAAEANGLRARMSEANDLAADGVISMQQLVQMTGRMQAKLDEIESTMVDQAIAASRDDFDGVRAWQDATLDQKRKMLSRHVRVRLLRVGSAGRHFDPDSVEVTLKS